MYKIIRKKEASKRQISDRKSVLDYVTKEISPNISLVIVKNEGYFGDVAISKDRIYYILSGELILKFGVEKVILKKDDACFISKNTSYIMSGDCKAIIVDQPAFGT